MVIILRECPKQRFLINEIAWILHHLLCESCAWSLDKDSHVFGKVQRAQNLMFTKSVLLLAKDAKDLARTIINDQFIAIFNK